MKCLRKQCGARNCRTNCGFNHWWQEGQKVNHVDLNMMEGEGVLFADSKRCFTITYLKFQEELVIRGALASTAAEWAYKSVFDARDKDAPYGRTIAHHCAVLIHGCQGVFKSVSSQGDRD